MKKENTRKIIAAIIAFGAAVTLSLAIIAITVGAVFSRPFFSLLTGNGYKQKVKAEVLEELESYAIPGGLPHDFFEGELDKALLYKDINRAVDGAFAGKTVTFETFSASVTDSIMRYAKENNIEVQAGDDSTEENIKHMASLCASKYKKLVGSEILKVSGAASRFLNPWVLIAAAALFGVSAALFVATHKIGKEPFLRIAFGGAGFMLFFFPLYFLIFKNISKLGITSPSMYALATGIIYSILITLVVLAAVLIVLANIPYKRKRSEE